MDRKEPRKKPDIRYEHDGRGYQLKEDSYDPDPTVLEGKDCDGIHSPTAETNVDFSRTDGQEAVKTANNYAVLIMVAFVPCYTSIYS